MYLVCVDGIGCWVIMGWVAGLSLSREVSAVRNGLGWKWDLRLVVYALQGDEIDGVVDSRGWD